MSSTQLPECHLEPAIVALIRADPFYGYTIQGLRRIITEDVETLAVEIVGSSVHLRVNPYFWNKAGRQGVRTQMDLLRHEVGHLIREHLFRRGSRLPHLWNLAADATINQWLTDLPRGCIYPETLGLPRDRTAEWYYDQLVNQQDSEPGDLSSGSEGGADPGPSNFDREDGLPDLSGHWHCDGSRWGQGRDQESDSYYIEQEIKGLVERSLERALHEAPGTVPGELIAQIQQAGYRTQPWKGILRRFIQHATNHYKVRSRSRPNRRTGLLNPGRRREHKLTVLCAYDTSASVRSEQLDQFMAEMDRLAGLAKVWGCEFDTVCHSVYHWEAGKRLEVKGRGGTDLKVPFAVADDIRPDCIIVFTDGEGPLPERPPRRPTLWVYTSNHRRAPWGQRIVLEV